MTIDVYVDGDWIEAETPEDAVYAARTYGRELRRHSGILGCNPRITFMVDDKVVRTTTLRDLNRL